MPMDRSAYAVKENEWCPSCLASGHHYRRNQREHFQTHVPRDRWPESMRGPVKPKRIVFEGRVYDRDDPRVGHLVAAEPSQTLVIDQSIGTHIDLTDGGMSVMTGEVRENLDRAVQAVNAMTHCECGWTVPADSKNPASAMRLHRAKAKQHREQGVRNG